MLPVGGDSYCIRRTKRIDSGLPSRPTIWMDAKYVNKDASNSFIRAAPEFAYGDVVENVNRGGSGESWAVLYAFSGRAGDYGSRRAAFAPYQLLSIRGISVDSDSFAPTTTHTLTTPGSEI